MDPLSIAASVVGLLAVGGKLTLILSNVTRLADAPPLCKAALVEVCELSAVLRQIRNFLNGRLAVPDERRECVLLEHLTTALTGCVMTKDQLETIVDDIGYAYAESGIT